MSQSEEIQVYEVGPRDGLQNEPKIVSFQDKVWFISSLIRAGIKRVEIGAFVHPKKVPQMADTEQVCKRVLKNLKEKGLTRKVQAWCLVPNQIGLDRAKQVGWDRVAVFTAATEGFAKANIGMSVQESLREFKKVIQEGHHYFRGSFHVRGYISTAFGCPFEGKVKPSKPLKVLEKLFDLGVEQVSIGDTIGVATPSQVNEVIRPALKEFGASRIAVHFHDTRGTALANALRAYDLGIRIFDSSTGGLGGCPFAKGATGNLATEDFLYMLNGMGIKTGIQLEELSKVSLEFARRLKRPLTSRYLQAYASKFKSQ